MHNQAKWDADYMDLALWWAKRKSKDPSTKVGAVVVDVNNNVASLCWNGFPKGVLDTEERYADRVQKYPRVVHAELNAVIAAGHNCRGGTIYVSPLHPCNECAKPIIQAGITRVVAPVGSEPENMDPDSPWAEGMLIAAEMFREAGVKVDYV